MACEPSDAKVGGVEFPAGGPRAEYHVEAVVEASRCLNGETLTLRPGGPMNYFRFLLSLSADFQAQLSSNTPPVLLCQFQLLPPPELAEAAWTCKDVEWEFTLFNWISANCACHSVSGKSTFSDHERVGMLDTLFVIDTEDSSRGRGWLNEKDQIRIRAAMKLPLPEAGASKSLECFDFSQEMKQVTFRLAEGACLFFDRRLLVSRSEYFREMLELGWKEGQTNEVDLSGDPEADERAFGALLVYIMSDAFSSKGDIDFAFSVRRLADRYGLVQLVDLVEEELEGLLCGDNVLAFFGQVVGSGGRLESACLELVKANGCLVLENNREKLDQIVEENSDLTKALLRLLVDSRNRDCPYCGDVAV